MPEPILSIRDLAVEFKTDDGIVHAVDGISYDVFPGETLGIVGESGSGKSVSTLALLGLIPQPPGRIVSGTAMFKGTDLLKMKKRELRRFRGDEVAMVFQDPMTSLNPVLKIVFTSPNSTIRPAYITITRSHISATMPRSCVMRIVAASVSACTRFSTSSTCAWIVTSRAVVGSSAIRRDGEFAIAIAIIARCRMPPENSWGYWLTRVSGFGTPTSRSRSTTRDLTSLSGTFG